MARLGGRNKVARKAVAATTAITSPDAVASVGVPTKVEFDRVVTLANELKADVNLLLAALKS